MPPFLRHCVECPKCHTRYLIAFSPYCNGSHLQRTAGGFSEEYILYCSCGRPPVSSRWRWSEVMRCAVSLGDPLITARNFSSCPSDSISRWTPCPPQTASGGFRSALAVSDFRLRARLDISIPSTSSASEVLNPAFGYGAPHPSAGGTSTLMINALLSTHHGSIRGSWPMTISGYPRGHNV